MNRLLLDNVEYVVVFLMFCVLVIASQLIPAYRGYRNVEQYQELLLEKRKSLHRVLAQQPQYQYQINYLKQRVRPVPSTQQRMAEIESSVIAFGLRVKQLKQFSEDLPHFQLIVSGVRKNFLSWLSLSLSKLPCFQLETFGFQQLPEEELAGYEMVLQSCE